ncbi:MAG: phosphoribosylglycinamide formyltransferase [Candidatus Omnitrophota bacterium]|nr:phosphoribosylglycinamide formyltransferase [Candidatus Omnitrophota bacterium]MDZ4241638.1 phosphoribosylglycinamide formyltransferase [Candidatus Omnitrophota bacterium]
MKFAVLISGNGSNLQAIIDAVKRGEIKAELGLVVSSNHNAYGLKRAEAAGIKTKVFSAKDYTNRQSVDRDMIICLKEEGIDFIVLAGYMRLLTPYFIKHYPQKILNVHPSLLPSFKGIVGIKDAFTYGVKITGVTIHYVDDKMDHGPIIAQETVRVAEDDTLETLTEKVHRTEHRVYPKAIALFVENRLKIKGRKVKTLDKPAPVEEAAPPAPAADTAPPAEKT